MKTITAILLSLLVFSQSVSIGISDILRIGELVEHAQYHAENYGDDFFTFLEKHYGDLRVEHQKNHQDEHSKHEKLPFQHNSVNHVVAEVTFISLGYPLKNPVVSAERTPNFHYENLYSFLEKHSVFQPPKSA